MGYRKSSKKCFWGLMKENNKQLVVSSDVVREFVYIVKKWFIIKERNERREREEEEKNWDSAKVAGCG